MSQLAERKGFKIESTLSEKKKKSKDKKSKPKVADQVKIIDDDAYVPWNAAHEPAAKLAEEEPDLVDDAPVVVGIVDERPPSLQEKERFKDMKRWKTSAFDEVPEPGSIGPQPKPQKSSSASRRKHKSSDDSDPELDRDSSKKNVDPDLSPPRRKTQQKNDDEDDPSPPRRRRNQQSDDDPSPPRRRNLSPPPKKERKDNDDDPSPPRRRNPSPPRRKQKHDDDPSPPRKRDSSPPRRKNRFDNDPSPPRKRDSSPPRRKNRFDGDSSPPRRRDRSSPPQQRNDRHSRHESPPSHRRVKQESPPLPSQPAKSERRRLAEHKEQVSERYAQWGRGLAQVRQTEDAVKDYLEQADKPLARYRDDESLDKLLKDREREDDPMLKYLTKKGPDTNDRSTGGNAAPPKPRYRGPDPQKNRFDIWPGYRWDGVDRSNGYEKKLFESIANRHAKAQEAYLWSVEDM
ncbi:unnamed protein product [Adineta ricciae]|uniref:BUD13 homolog n=1 Tax=Adineta ricciae TaxID=249248 RepID=A0A814YYB3_ADIRI|nr:unnamed protein product [Adineta ricciae]CAF1236401.1 unnamed protein product [Adineta ricciae]